MSNGKALVSTSLNTGEYEVTIKDLTAGDKEAYNEKETFTVESRSLKTSDLYYS